MFGSRLGRVSAWPPGPSGATIAAKLLKHFKVFFGFKSPSSRAGKGGWERC